MKKRTFNLLNFLALNVLFFAVYLNFIHKDANTLPTVSASSHAAARSIAANTIKNAVQISIQQKNGEN